MADQQSPGLLRRILPQAAPGPGFLPVILVSNFEGGTSGTSISTANSGGASGPAFDSVNIPSGATLAFDGTMAAHGTVSAQVALGATSQVWAGWTSKLGRQNSKCWFRVYAYFTANPAAVVTIFQFKTPAADGNANTAALKVGTGGTVSFQDAAFGTVITSTTTIPLNQWFRLEGWAAPGTGTGQLSFSIYPADSPVATETKTSAATQNLTTAIGQALYGDLNSGTAGPFWIDDVGVSNTGPLGPVIVPPVPAWPQALTLVARGFPQSAPSPQVPQPPAPVPAAQNAAALLQQGLPQTAQQPNALVPPPPGIQAAQSVRFLAQGRPQQAPSPQLPAAPPPLPAPSQGTALLQLRLPQQAAQPNALVPAPAGPAPSQAPALLQLGLPQTAQQPNALVPPPAGPAPSQGITLLLAGLPQQAAHAQLPVLLPPPPSQQSLVLVARGTPQARHYFQLPLPPPPAPGVLTTLTAAAAALTAADAGTGTLTAAAASSSLTGVTSC